MATAAIWLDNCGQGIVSNNVHADGSDDDFIFAENPIHVVLDGNAGGTIRVESTSAQPIVITNNKAEGIAVDGCPISTIAENTVRYGAIEIDDCEMAVVENNRVWTYTGPGIMIADSDTIVVRGNVGSGAEGDTDAGWIELSGTMADPIIEHNIYQGIISGSIPLDYGIKIGANVSDARLQGNLAPDAAVRAVEDLSTSGAKWGDSLDMEWTFPGTVAVTTTSTRRYARRSLEIIDFFIAGDTAPTGADLIIDVHVDGTTIFPTATRPTIAAGNNEGSAAVPDTTAVAAGSYLQVFIDQIGSTVAGADVSLVMRYRWTD